MKGENMNDLQRMEERLWSIAAELAQKWFKLQTTNKYAHFYLYYRPSAHGRPGLVEIAEDMPKPFVIADLYRISPASTQEQVKQRIYHVMRTLPIL